MFFRKHRELTETARRHGAVVEALHSSAGGIYAQRDNLQALTVYLINTAPALLARCPQILDTLDEFDSLIVSILGAAGMHVMNPAPSAIAGPFALSQGAEPLPFHDSSLVPNEAEEVVIELQGARPLDRAALIAQLGQVMQRLERGDVIGEADDGVIGYRFAIRDASNAPQFFDPTTSTR